MSHALLAVVALVVALIASPTVAAPCAGFTDVEDTSPFCPNVTWLRNRNITFGCAATLYCPNDPVTRLQMAAFMNRLGNALFPLTCAAGQVMKWDGVNWGCANDNIGGSGGGGTVTSVAAGTGLQASPNPITGAGAINVAPSYQLPQACANGQVAKSNGAGGWTCAADNDTNSGGTVTSLTAGTGITLTPSPITTTGSIAVNTTTIQQRVSGACAVGSSIRAIAADGTVTCQADSTGPANPFVHNGNAFGATAVLGTTDGSALDIRVNNSRVMRYEPNAVSPNVIGGSPANNVIAGVRGATIAGGGVPTGNTDPDFGVEAPNRVTDAYGTVGGGFGNRAGDDAGTTIDSPLATVAGGWDNTASGGYSTVGGGQSNIASWLASTVGGGQFNIASNFYSTVGGGSANSATGDSSTIGGGESNTAGGFQSTVGGGGGNTASGSRSTVGGGAFNAASGDYSWAAGRRAKAAYPGAFLWADSTDLDFKVQANEIAGGWNNAANTFNVRATGGVWFVTAVEVGTGRPTAGAWLGAGGSAWNVTSDAASKVDVHAVDPQEILERALTIEVSRWRYRTAPGTEHIGPMAQDFHRAFNVGSDERSIATVDADGVALAAIQGLNAKLEAKIAEQARENARQARDLAAQQAQIAELERLVAQLLARP